jgi:hypothetical protein
MSSRSSSALIALLAVVAAASCDAEPPAHEAVAPSPTRHAPEEARPGPPAPAQEAAHEAVEESGPSAEYESLRRELALELLFWHDDVDAEHRAERRRDVPRIAELREHVKSDPDRIRTLFAQLVDRAPSAVMRDTVDEEFGVDVRHASLLEREGRTDAVLSRRDAESWLKSAEQLQSGRDDAAALRLATQVAERIATNVVADDAEPVLAQVRSSLEAIDADAVARRGGAEARDRRVRDVRCRLTSVAATVRNAAIRHLVEARSGDRTGARSVAPEELPSASLLDATAREIEAVDGLLLAPGLRAAFAHDVRREFRRQRARCEFLLPPDSKESSTKRDDLGSRRQWDLVDQLAFEMAVLQDDVRRDEEGRSRPNAGGTPPQIDEKVARLFERTSDASALVTDSTLRSRLLKEVVDPLHAIERKRSASAPR